MDSSSFTPPNQTQSAESSLAEVYWRSMDAKQHSSTLEGMLEKEKMRADAAEAVMQAEKNRPDAPRTPQTPVVPQCSCPQCHDAKYDEAIYTVLNSLEHRADAAETKLALETKRADAAAAALATEKDRADAAESALAQEKGHAEVALFAFSQQKDRADAAEASLGHNDKASETTLGPASPSNPDISID